MSFETFQLAWVYSIFSQTITPVKSVRVVGSMPTDNSVSITGTSGSNSVSADVMFNRADRTFEATIKLNPCKWDFILNMLYNVSWDINR